MSDAPETMPRRHQRRPQLPAEVDRAQETTRDVAPAGGREDAPADPEDSAEALFSGWKCALKR
jgi:hypothetical protein